MTSDTSDKYREHLRRHAAAYYPAWAGVDVPVRLIDTRPLKSSTLFRFELGGQGDAQRVLVKQPKVETARYRRARQTEPELKFRLEFEALTAIHDHFRRLDDARFGAVRALDFIADDAAIVVEESRDPSFRRVLMRAHRLKGRGPGRYPLGACFRNAGAWLRIYSDLPERRGAEELQADRDCLEQGLMDSTAYLARVTHAPDYFRELSHRTVAEGRRVLPRSLPLGLKHGDYALRNLLVGVDGRVTGLDTQARWRTPIYDDVAYFVVELETNWPQVLSQGLAFRRDQLRGWSRQFLEGYFEGDRPPLDALRVFQIKVLCQKWAAHLYRLERMGEQGRHSVRSWMRPLTNRFFRRYAEQLWASNGP